MSIIDNLLNTSYGNQKERLLDYLQKNGSINPLEAWKELGIYRLSATILELRKQGHIIETTRMDVKNRFNEKCHVAKYVYKGTEYA